MDKDYFGRAYSDSKIFFILCGQWLMPQALKHLGKWSMDSPANQLSDCIGILRRIADDHAQLALLSEQQRIELMQLCGKISRPHRQDRKKLNKTMRRIAKVNSDLHDKTSRALTGIRRARESSVYRAPEKMDMPSSVEAGRLNRPRQCYICKASFHSVHHFYADLCRDCGDFNYAKRFQTCDMTGQVAIITGGRVKIGYQTALKILRCGARLILTTRFPVDAAARFAKEADFSNWRNRLHIYGLDLRHLPSVELFCKYIQYKYDRLDVLINNAAQTVRRPVGYYAHLMQSEQLPFHAHPSEVQQLLNHHKECVDQLEREMRLATEPNLPINWKQVEPGMGLRKSALLSQVPYHVEDAARGQDVFPIAKLDADLQQVDLRTTNSWRLRMGEIETSELIEVQLINAMAPFILINKLIGWMRKDFTGAKHIVNVTAMEGKFHRFKKSDRHPHTNMAKAALNMLTHTSASDFAKDGIYMNAVDTGWVTDEDPVQLAQIKKETHDFQPPLDIVDGAARVCDPFIDGILTGKHWCGKFLKDFRPIDW